MDDKTKKTKIQRIIKKENFSRWISELMKEFEVIAPVKENKDENKDSEKDVFFRIIKSPEEVCMDFHNTVLSPKEFFFPKSEKILEFEGEEILNIDLNKEGNKETEILEKKRILFGVRPCDANSLILLDNVYLGDVNDPYYSKRRKNTKIISLSCIEPEEQCFCKSMNTGPFSCESDVLLTDLGDRYFAESENKDLLNYDIFKEPSSEDIKLKDEKQKESEDKIKKTINLNNLKKSNSKTGVNFDDAQLDEKARKCLTCGCCTFICPTCTCFDVFDESMISARKGVRIRCWDSCMFPSFTVLSGGENPRKKKADRFRQRLYHKFKYYPERYGIFACVGCGRCIKNCPVNIDIVEIINKTNEKGK